MGASVGPGVYVVAGVCVGNGASGVYVAAGVCVGNGASGVYVAAGVYVGSGASGVYVGSGVLAPQANSPATMNMRTMSTSEARSSDTDMKKPLRGQVANRQTRFLPSRATRGRDCALSRPQADLGERPASNCVFGKAIISSGSIRLQGLME